MDDGDTSGGSAELARLIDEYGEFLIPDLNHYYAIDLRELFSDDRPLQPRWVLIHIKHLPIESSFVAELRGGQHFRGWDENRYQLATLINASMAVQHTIVLANLGKDSRKPKAPEPYPLPDKKTKAKAPDKPGSFGFIAKSLIAKGKKRKEAAGG